jgi:hypothetical protein
VRQRLFAGLPSDSSLNHAVPAGTVFPVADKSL